MSKAPHPEEIEVGIRELRAHLSRYLTQVDGGASLTVTDRGRAVARLVPVSEERSGLQRLIDAGLVRLPERPATDPRTWRRVPVAKGSVADLLIEQRR